MPSKRPWKVLGPWWSYVGEQECRECEAKREHCWATGAGWTACQRHFRADAVREALLQLKESGDLCPAP